MTGKPAEVGGAVHSLWRCVTNEIENRKYLPARYL